MIIFKRWLNEASKDLTAYLLTFVDSQTFALFESCAAYRYETNLSLNLQKKELCNLTKEQQLLQILLWDRPQLFEFPIRDLSDVVLSNLGSCVNAKHCLQVINAPRVPSICSKINVLLYHGAFMKYLVTFHKLGAINKVFATFERCDYETHLLQQLFLVYALVLKNGSIMKHVLKSAEFQYGTYCAIVRNRFDKAGVNVFGLLYYLAWNQTISPNLIFSKAVWLDSFTLKSINSLRSVWHSLHGRNMFLKWPLNKVIEHRYDPTKLDDIVNKPLSRRFDNDTWVRIYADNNMFLVFCLLILTLQYDFKSNESKPIFLISVFCEHILTRNDELLDQSRNVFDEEPWQFIYHALNCNISLKYWNKFNFTNILLYQSLFWEEISIWKAIQMHNLNFLRKLKQNAQNYWFVNICHKYCNNASLEWLNKKQLL